MTQPDPSAFTITDTVLGAGTSTQSRDAHPQIVTRKKVTIQSVNVTGGTAVVTWPNGDTSPVGFPYLSSYLPIVGEVAFVDRVQGSPIIVGKAGTRRIGCTLRRTVTLTSNVQTSIQWDTEDYDPYGFITVTSATITIPAGLTGEYDVNARAFGTFTPAARAFIQITPTSSIANTPADFRVNQPSVENRLFIAVAGLPLNAGDSFTVDVFHNQGAGVSTACWVTCYRVGD